MESILIKCSECNIEFQKNKSEYNRKCALKKINFFCSLRCGTIHQIRNQEKQKRIDYTLNKKTCIFCKSDLLYEDKNNKFCNQSCAAKFNNSKKRKNKTCLICDSVLNPSSGNRTKCCSITCSSVNKRQKMLDLIKSGLYKPKSCQTSTLRKYLIEMRGYQCENCKNDCWMNQKICLTLDHINGDATDNTLENLRLLCWNCHSITPNFGSKNKNGTRISRKARYLPVSSNARTIIRNDENVDSNSTTGSNFN